MKQFIERSNRRFRIPSLTHEARVRSLETLADVAGFCLPMSLADGRRPDVVRRPLLGEGLFIGEAKYTEGPTDQGSLDRLRAYLGWLAALETPHARCALVVAHSFAQGEQWRSRLVWLCEPRLDRACIWTSPIAPGTSVTALTLGGAASRPSAAKAA